MYIHHIAIAVNDLEGALQFYRDALGQIGRASCRERVLVVV